MNRLRLLAASTGIIGVTLGALGAHALQARLVANQAHDAWQTAVLYHLIHALAAFAVSLPQASTPTSAPLHRAAWCWLVGVLLFSGSIYALALGGPRILGPVTPIGGIFFLVGWGLAARSAWSKST